MCIQESNIRHISKESGMATSWRFPWGYLVSFGGIQILGYFNATSISDKGFLAINRKPFEKSINPKMDYRHLDFGASPIDKNGNRNENVTHYIKLRWD
jgi:hypothetical protein